MFEMRERERRLAPAKVRDAAQVVHLGGARVAGKKGPDALERFVYMALFEERARFAQLTGSFGEHVLSSFLPSVAYANKTRRGVFTHIFSPTRSA